MTGHPEPTNAPRSTSAPHSPAHRGGVSATDCELVTATEFRRMDADRAALMRLDVVLQAIERIDAPHFAALGADIRAAVDPDGTILKAQR